MKPHLQRLATAGNTGALMLLMFVLVNAPVLVGVTCLLRPRRVPGGLAVSPAYGNGAAGPLRGGRWAASG